MPLRVATTTVAAAALAVTAQGLECSHTCGTPGSLAFCTHVDFAVCGSGLGWDELDNAAATAYDRWTNATTAALRQLPQYKDQDTAALEATITALDLRNATSSCGKFLKRLECAAHFPVCEIGRDYKHVCMKSCEDTAKKACPGLQHICDTFTPTEVERKGKCFKLSYNGPAVGLWIAGFTISLVFSILNSVGINLQKLSMTRNELAEVKKGTFSQPLWVLGFGLVVLGSLLDFVAFGMAPQTLLAPLAALSLVWNMFIAPIFHKEKVTAQNIMATVIIFIGVTLTVIFAGHSTPEYELEDLIALYKQPVMYVYMFLIGSFLGGLLYFARFIERTHKYEGGIYHIACYGGVAGTFGGQSVLLAKSTVELLKSAIWGQSGAAMFMRFPPYLIVIGLGGCLACQVHYLNCGLARFDALVVIPVYQSFWILTSVLGGIMYFEEYTTMTKTQAFMFTIGGIITISGIVYLLKSRQEGGGGEDSGRYVELAVTPSSAWNTDDSDEEEVIQLKTHNKLDDDDVGTKPHKSASVSPPTSVSSSGSSSPVRHEKSKKISDASDISSAIYRASPPTKPSGAGSRPKDEDEDDFI